MGRGWIFLILQTGRVGDCGWGVVWGGDARQRLRRQEIEADGFAAPLESPHRGTSVLRYTGDPEEDTFDTEKILTDTEIPTGIDVPTDTVPTPTVDTEKDGAVGGRSALRDYNRHTTVPRQLKSRSACMESEEGSPYERQCLVQCHNIAGHIYPEWWQFEEFCQQNVGDWGKECQGWYECLYGCDILGGDRAPMTDAVSVAQKTRLVLHTNLANWDGETKCEMMKCRSYCGRHTFLSCREFQQRAQCEELIRATAGLQRCDVDCAEGRRTHGLVFSSSCLVIGIAVLAWRL